MPNHCINLLTMTGSASELATFCNYALQKDDEIMSSCPDLHYLYPIPDNVVKDKDPQILSRTDYKWRVDNWDTKWNTYENAGLAVLRSNVSDRLLGVQCEFESAWSPPLGAIRVGSAKFPSLTFTLEFIEPGVAFRGVAVYKNGKEVFQHIEDDLTGKEWDIVNEDGFEATYRSMTDPFQVEHIKTLNQDFNMASVMRLPDFTGSMF